MKDRKLKSCPKNHTTPRIFVAGTRMNDGKTTTCLGLFAALQQKYSKVGFIKPIGQRFVKIDGQLIDEDSILLEKTYNVETPISSMSPIAIDGSFTKRYLDDPEKMGADLTDKVCNAFDRASWEKNFTLIEGSGHAGVGSVFELSNARVAKLLGAKAIIVSRGGIGQPIDEIALNKVLFDQEGVEVVGAIINKVEANKMDMIRKYTSLALKRLSIPLLGLLPSEKVLTSPNLEQIRERVNGTPLNCVDEIRPRRFRHIVIGAMTVTGFLDTVPADTLLITPGDREDIVLAVLSNESHHTSGSIACIILTRGIRPSPALLERIVKSRIPFISVSTDSYTVASRIHSMTVKTQPGDDDKIPLIKKIIQENIDLNQIIDAFTLIKD